MTKTESQQTVSFRELYRRELEKETAGAAFIRRICEATGKCETAVRKWISGETVPCPSDRKVIAGVLGVNPDGLFDRPAYKRTKQKKNKKK